MLRRTPVLLVLLSALINQLTFTFYTVKKLLFGVEAYAQVKYG